MSERARLESLLRIPLSETMIAEAADLARAVSEAARRAAATLPAAPIGAHLFERAGLGPRDARDPTGFLATLESLAPKE